MIRYFTVIYNNNLLCVLAQNRDGTDSIGSAAKENIFINNLEIKLIPEEDEGLYVYMPIVKAKNLEKYLLTNNIVPY